MSDVESGYPPRRRTSNAALARPLSARSGREQPQQQRSYSITSSARPRSVGGTSRPSALAVLRLITSSYLVGACTGGGWGDTAAARSRAADGAGRLVPRLPTRTQLGKTQITGAQCPSIESRQSPCGVRLQQRLQTAQVCFRPAQCPAPKVRPEHPSLRAFRQFPHSDA